MVPKRSLKKPRSMKTTQSLRELRKLSKRAVLEEQVAEVTPKAQHPNSPPVLPRMSQ
jgi:hypothetical protein